MNHDAFLSRRHGVMTSMLSQVVESALLVKKDAEMRGEDPLTFYMSPTCVNYELSANLLPKSEPVSNVSCIDCSMAVTIVINVLLFILTVLFI